MVTESVTPPENNPASGSPIIEGDPNPGETLSASLEDIADDDGISDSVFAFQWYRFDGTDNDAIANATSDILNIDEDDVGDAISVTVSFVDDLGNDEFLTSHSVVVETVEPLAGFIDDDTVPGEHDGYQSFTFELYFSEEPVLGFEAVRDHVLDVINGDVTSVRRTTQGSNIRWEITVQPDGNDEVTLLLPFTDNCDDEGAVCNASGEEAPGRSGGIRERPRSKPGTDRCQHGGHRNACHHGDRPRGRDPDGRHVRHRRRRRADQRRVQPPVGVQRRNHRL